VSIIQSRSKVQDGRQAQGQAEFSNPEVVQRYRTAVRDRQRGQAGRYRVRTGKGQKPEARENERPGKDRS
jgi:hypothetical protein